MDKKLKAAWVKALRSGKYKQGRVRLKNEDDTYCCLGVLCAIHPDVEEESLNSDEGPLFVWNMQMLRNSLGGPFLYHVGLRDIDQVALVKLNDIEEKDFLEIAQYIEENL
jgi:hypothetical protein